MASSPPRATTDTKFDLVSTPITKLIPQDKVDAILSSPPFVAIPGAMNLRDIGLLPGSAVRARLIYRSAFLSSMPLASLNLLSSQLGVRTIFDLRQEHERERNPSPQIDGIKTVWLRTEEPHRLLPSDFIDDEGVPGFLQMYDEILKLYRESFRAVLVHLRDEEHVPILFHCTAGKDRTGVLAVLLYSLIDTPPELISMDYLLTRIGIEREREVLNKSLEKWLGADAMNQPGVFELGSVSARVINEFQDHLREKYGGAKGYCRDVLGFDDKDLFIICNNIKHD